jgi:hypothetical protein
MRSRVDWADVVFLRIAEHLTATNPAGIAARAKSRHKLLWRRSGAPLVTVVEKSGSARIGR